jgi:dihydrofolate synthase / folylpolyglutamate synthase
VQLGPEGTSFTIDGENPVAVRTPLLGAHQAENAATTMVSLDAAGFVSWPNGADPVVIPPVVLPGRFQRVGRWIFDVAHNPSGAEVLADTLRSFEQARPLVVLLAVLGDKDWRSMMRSLARVADDVVLTVPPSAPPNRVWNVEDALAFACTLEWRAVAETGFDTALARAEATGATILATGSFHTVGDAMARLQVNPLAA